MCTLAGFPRQNLLCDVTLVAGATEVSAHKTVLASCSPYFYAMFTGFTESRANKITLQGLDGTALALLIDYVYSAEVQVTEENVQVGLSCLPLSESKVHSILAV